MYDVEAPPLAVLPAAKAGEKILPSGADRLVSKSRALAGLEGMCISKGNRVPSADDEEVWKEGAL